MDVLFVLLPVALAFAAVAVAVFVWAARSGQFDDLTTPAVRILLDDDGAPAPPGREPERARAPGRGSPILRA